MAEQQQQQQQKNRHSVSLWTTTKDEASLVAAGCVLGAVAGVGGGYIVSQVAGTPLTASLVVGGVSGAAVGGGVAIGAAHCVKEARAEGALYTDLVTADAIAQVTGQPALTKKPDVAELVESGMTGALKNAKIGEQIGAALDRRINLLPAQVATELYSRFETPPVTVAPVAPVTVAPVVTA